MGSIGWRQLLINFPAWQNVYFNSDPMQLVARGPIKVHMQICVHMFWREYAGQSIWQCANAAIKLCQYATSALWPSDAKRVKIIGWQSQAMT